MTTEPLDAELNLTIEPALQSVSELGAQIEATVSAAAETASASIAEIIGAVPDVEIPVTADVADAETAIEGIGAEPVDVPVTADTTDAIAAVDDVATKAESEHPTIQVDADTSEAEAAIEAVSSAAEDATGSLEAGGHAAEGFGESSAALAGFAGLATGEVAGLGEAAKGLGGGPAIGGIAALAGGVGEIVHEGLAATSAIQRFNVIVGDMADEVERVQVGTLNEDLDKLGLSLGSTSAEMKDTVSNLFQFAINSGASREQAASFSNEIVALAARAVALKPALGNVGDVADQMGVRIARGGRFAQNFSLALTAAEINARALGDTGKTTAGDLTIYEKAQAAANIAAERYGGVLGTDVANGAKNAANEQKALVATLKETLEEIGRPLVAPFLEAFRAALPDVKEIAAALGEFAAAVLPTVIAALKDIEPILSVLTEGVKAFTSAFGDLGAQGEVTGALIGFAFGGPLGAIIGTAVGFFGDLAGALDEGAQSAADFRSETDKLVTSLRDVPAATAIAKVIESVTVGGKQGIVDLDALIRRIRQVSEESPTLGARLAKALNDAGFAAVATKAQQEALNDAVEHGRHVFSESAKATDEVAKGDAAIRDAAAGSVPAIDSQAGALDGATQAAVDFVTALKDQDEIQQRLVNEQLGLTGALLNYRQAVDDQTKAQKDYNEALASGDPDRIAEAELRKEEADLRVAESTVALSQAQDALNVDLNDPTAVNNALAKLRDLQAQYPATAGALQPYVEKLTEQKQAHDLAAVAAFLNQVNIDNLARSIDDIAGLNNPTKTVTVEVIGKAQLDEVYNTFAALTGIPNVGFTLFPTSAAEGAIIPPKPGGTLVNVGEAGAAEAIVPTDDPERAWELLVQSGIAAQIAPYLHSLEDFLAGLNAPAPSVVGVIQEDSPLWQWWSMGNKQAGVDYAAANPPPPGVNVSEPFLNEVGAWVVQAFQKGGRTDWPENEARLAVLHGQETIINRAQMADLMGVLAHLPTIDRTAFRLPEARTGERVVSQTYDQRVIFEEGSIDASRREDPARIAMEIGRQQRSRLQRVSPR